MPLPPPGAPQQENPIQQLIDLANTKAFQRGAKKPGWTDLWSALSETGDYAEVMSKRGVRISSFGADLDFLSKIGPKKSDSPFITLESTQFTNSQTLRAARDELIDHMRRMEDELGANLSDEDRDNLTQALVKIRTSMVTKDIGTEGGREKFMLKMRLLEKAVTKMMMGSDAAIALGEKGGKPDPMASIKITQIAKSIAHFLYQDEMDSYEEENDDIVGLLEGLKAESMFEPPSAMKVFETVKVASGDAYNKLLLRNGYFSTDDDTVQTDELAPLFPNDFIRNLALRALEIAYQTQSKEVDKKHVIAALLENRHVMVNLSKLGMKDQMKFVEKYFELAFGKQEDDDTRKIRSHPKVTDAFKDIIWQFNERVKEWDDEVRGPELLRQTFREDKEADKLLNGAGLLRKMQSSWRSAYDEDWKLKKDDKDDKKEKKKEEEFKTPDIFFEKLIEYFCTDYTALARKKKFDPLIGQAGVMDEVITTLLKRGKKNPVTTGEAGIGKTKILEGLAMRIASGKVPAKLVGSRLLTIDTGRLSPPYAMYVDMLLQGISERNASGRFPLIAVGVDELAAAVKHGGIGETLKPYLTRGDLFMIANSTTKEYQRDVQKDPALARRFNPIAMNAPTVDETVEILKQLKARYAKHHGVRIPDAMLKLTAKLADRFISTNQPDKSIDVLDHACAIAARTNQRTLAQAHIITAVSAASNISKEFLSQDDKERYRKLPENLKKEILQQDNAVDAVTAPLQRSRIGMREKGKPMGVFLFVGPSGVGKTELTRGLARNLYGDDEEGKSLLRYDMTEFMEKHSVSKFIGSPPGYVGHDEGGRLINDVNAHPFSVVLYDEIEKAHEDVHKALIGPFGSGKMTDGQGRSADFKNTLNIMTSNVGNEYVLAEGARLGLDPIKDHAAWQKMARPIYQAAVKAAFPPEFLGRLDGVIYFDNLTGETIELLTDRRIEVTRKQLQEANNGLDIQLGEHFRKAVIAQGFDPAYGARPLNNAVKNMVETPLARFLLEVPDNKLKKVKSVFAEVAADWVPPEPDVIAAGGTKPDFALRY